MELRKQEEVAAELQFFNTDCEIEVIYPTYLIRERLKGFYEQARSELAQLAEEFELLQMSKFGRPIVRSNFIFIHSEDIIKIPGKLPFIDDEIKAFIIRLMEADQQAEFFHSFI